MDMRRFGSIVAIMAGPALFGCAGLETEIPVERTNAPYVPTPYSTVHKMLDLAQARPGDVLYDLGSGDGRIPITAAERYGVSKATGIEIDPDLVLLSNGNARKAGVADRVRFMTADIFKTDFSDATIITLYLLQDLNLELRPRFLRELKPGTRIVSHRFDLGDWMHDGYAKIDDTAAAAALYFGDENVNSLYLWIVPAAAGGRWRITAGAESYALNLTQIYQEVEGTIAGVGAGAKISDGRLTGDRLRFRAQAQQDGRPVAIAFDGQVTGQTMSGTLAIGGRTMPAEATFVPN